LLHLYYPPRWEPVKTSPEITSSGENVPGKYVLDPRKKRPCMEEGVGKNVLNKIRRKQRPRKKRPRENHSGKNVLGKNVPQSGGGS
jgi:hypothetical protein